MKCERTIAIIDEARNGTTMVTGIYAILGVPMFNRAGHIQPMTYEDMDIINTVIKDEAKFAANVQERNEKYKVWGFKMVGGWRVGDRLKKYLINPVYIAIFKDPVSLARRRFEHDINIYHIEHVLNQWHKTVDGLIAFDEKVHVLNYWDAIVDPVKFIHHLAEIAQLDADPLAVARAAAWIQPNNGDRHADYPDLEQWL